MQLPEPYRLRPMAEADVPQVVEIEQQVLPSPWLPSVFHRELNENKLAHYAVLLAGQRVIGYTGYWLVGDEAQINIIAVHPEWQGQGLGRLLLLLLLREAYQWGADIATLEVRKRNVPAQRLYATTGFVLVGERRGYYQDTGDDALLMTLEPLDDTAFSDQLHALLERISAAAPGV